MTTKPTPNTTKRERRQLRAGQQQRPMMAELYRQAEAELRKQRKKLKAKPGRPVVEADPARQLHELQVHQVELEMQNVEMQKIRDDLEIALEKYTDLYEFAPVGYFTLTPDSTIRLVNLTGTVLVGLERARLVGRSFAGLLVAERRSEFQSFLKQVFAGRTHLSRDFELLRPGQPPCAVNIEAQRLPDGQECRAVIVDITARKQAEEKVQESEERFRVMANAMPQLAWIARPDGHIFWYNQRWYDYTGTTPKQMEGWGWQSVHDAVELPKVLKRWKASIATGETFDMTFPLRGADGVFRPFLTRVIPLKNADGRVVQWFGTNTDVTEQKLAEDKVRVSEVRYRRLFEAAHDGVLILDPGTRKITEANPFMTRLLGYQHDQLVGKELFEIGLLKDEAASQAMFQKLKHDHEVRYEDLPLVSRGGRHQEVEVVASLYQQNGHAVIQCNIRDITERKRTQEALREGEERYRNLFNSMDEGYCTIEMIFDQQGKPVDYRYLEINPSFERLTGLHGALGKRVREFVPDLEERWFEIYGQVARTGEPIRVADEVKGMNRWFDIHAFRIGGNGSPKLAVFFRNITERKQAEKALRQSEERYHTLFTSIDEGFCVIEMMFDRRKKPVDYRFLEVNPTFEKQTGLIEATGKRMRELVPEIESHWIEIYGQVALTGESIRFINEAKAMGGRWFDAYACRVGGADSRKVAIIFNDITARKNTEQQLAEKARLLDLSHDAIIVRDMKGRIRYWNHGAEELYGWSRKEALGKISHHLLQTEFHTPLKQITEELHRTDRWIGELVHTKRDGQRITALVRKTLDRDRQGRPASVLENISDITARKQMEEALRTSEAFNRSVVESSPDCIKVLDPSGHLLSFLHGAQELLGIDDVRPYLNKSWIGFWAGKDRQAARRAVAAAAAGGEGYFVGLFRTLRQEPKWWDVRISPILGPHGQPSRLLAVSRDVTGRKREELNLSFLASVSQDLVRAAGVDEMMRTVGAKLGAHFGLSACAFVEVHEADHELTVTHDWHRKAVPGLAGVYRQADFLKKEFLRLARAGETIVVRDVATDPRTNPAKFAALKIGSFISVPLLRDGQWLFALCLYHSTTHDWREDEIQLARETTVRLWTRLERLRAMEALHASEERFRAAVGVVSSLIWTNNAEGLMEGEQPGWTSFTGQTLKEYQGYGWAKAVHPQDAPATLAAWKRAVAKKTVFEFEHRLRRRDGEWRLCSIRAVPLLGEDGQIREWVGVHTDITARKQAEETDRRLAVLGASNRKLEKEIVWRQAVQKVLQQKEREQKKLIEQARHLAYQVRHAEENERTRISRELHDQVAQTLVGINVHLSALTTQPGLGNQAFYQQISRTQQLVEKSVDTVHRFARELRPTMLDDLGLIPALKAFLKTFIAQTGLRVELEFFAEVEQLDNTKRTVLYRVALEALTNVDRHARATAVEMSIQKQASQVCMIIQDNGQSPQVDPMQKARRHNRLGLIGMRERLEMVGGRFEIQCVEGEGTTVRAEVPFLNVRGGASTGSARPKS